MQNFAFRFSPAVKKKGRKKKIKDSPPKSSSSTSTSTTSTKLPKVETETEASRKPIEVKEEVICEENDSNVDTKAPAAGQEPAGPDQNLPVSADVLNPPPERKAAVGNVRSVNNSLFSLVSMTAFKESCIPGRQH